MFRDGHELAKEGDEWVYGEQGMMEPFVVEHEDGLGLQMPPRSITVKEVAELVGACSLLDSVVDARLAHSTCAPPGPKTPLEVIDCASQSSLSNWTLGQWAKYYDDPKRDKVRNVISLEVSESRLGAMVQAPELVRCVSPSPCCDTLGASARMRALADRTVLTRWPLPQETRLGRQRLAERHEGPWAISARAEVLLDERREVLDGASRNHHPSSDESDPQWTSLTSKGSRTRC